VNHPKLITALALVACAPTVQQPIAELTKEERLEIQDRKQSQEAADKVAEIRAAVTEEAKRLGPDHWAGSYYYGDGMGVNVSLSIAPEAGFAFEWHGCMGLYDRNYGAIEQVDGLLHLSLTFHNSRKGFQGIDESFRPILWGERQHLVAQEQMIEFCNAVNQGSSGHNTLVKRSESMKEVFGVPNVPSELLPYLLKNPVRAEIIGVGETTLCPSVCEWFFHETEVTLNVGADQGVLVGMEFNLTDPDKLESAMVQQVFKDSCIAVVSRIDDDEKPAVGWKLWTGSPFSWLQD